MMLKPHGTVRTRRAMGLWSDRMKRHAWTIAAALLLGTAALRAQNNPGDVGFPYGDLREVTLRGKLISLQEVLPRKYGAKAGGGGEAQWALALPEGQVYTFFDNAAYRKLVAEKPADGAVEIKARHFPRTLLLEVVTFQPTAAAGLQRRFYCSVCSIYSQDWGPCACCGKEYELVKP